MADGHRQVWITGIGILSCLGEGLDAHWQGLHARRQTADATSFAPQIVHPLGPVDFDKQIPKKSDQRQMEPWQRIGTYTAGLALEHARIKGNAELSLRTDMIVAAGGGERDLAVDGAIMTGMVAQPQDARFLNDHLMSDLRPTLFLAQLSNLLAGNISIVHGIGGSSRTFMGEEAAGSDAVRTAFARVRTGQSTLTLVGGAFNSERREMHLLYECGGYNLKDTFRPVWQRAPAGGFALGSIGAFLVLEDSEHARARGVAPVARLSEVVVGRANREPGSVSASLQKLWEGISPKVDPHTTAVMSGANGAERATAEERAFLTNGAHLPVRAPATPMGHGMEAHFAMNIALAALAVNRARLFPPQDDSGMERDMTGPLHQAVVTGVGHWRGEALALVERAT